MAGEANTLQDKTAKAHSSLVNLDGTDDVGESLVATAEDISATQKELEELRTQNARYKQQMDGWQAQSKRNMTERDQMADRLARLEGRIEATTNGKVADIKQEAALKPGKLKSALQKWLDNDDSELNEVEEYLASASKPRVTTSEPDIEQVVTKTLQKFGTKSNLTSQIAKAHPEMENSQSQLYGAIFEAYDDYANNPDNKLFFPHDDQFMVPVPAPNGGASKMMDARIVRQLASELKLADGVVEGRRQESRASSFGTAQSGNGRTTSTQRNRSVEAIELLTLGEREEMTNLKMLKAWPKEWPRDEKAAAKMIYDNLPAAEKARRTAEYRRVRG